MEVFFGLNKKNLKMCRLETKQGEASKSSSGFLSLPAERCAVKGSHSQQLCRGGSDKRGPVTKPGDSKALSGRCQRVLLMAQPPAGSVLGEDNGCVPGRT